MEKIVKIWKIRIKILVRIIFVVNVEILVLHNENYTNGKCGKCSFSDRNRIFV